MNNDNFQMYMNSGYKNPINKKKTLVLDIDDSNNTYLVSGSEFTIDLFEPLIIDKQSEVYLDNFLTFNCNLSSGNDQSAFCLKINEFNMNGNVASNKDEQSIFNSIIIPNENNNIYNYFSSVIHKGKKFNYLCDINPTTISRLTGKITDLTGNPMFHGNTAGTSQRYTYAITGIENWGANGRYLLKNELVTSIIPNATAADGPSALNKTYILTHTRSGASTIYFSSDKNITETDFLNKEIIIILPAKGDLTTLTITLTTALNPSMQLVKGNGRFTAEFSIVSRE
jgi:hypothetical protein